MKKLLALLLALALCLGLGATALANGEDAVLVLPDLGSWLGSAGELLTQNEFGVSYIVTDEGINTLYGYMTLLTENYPVEFSRWEDGASGTAHYLYYTGSETLSLGKPDELGRPLALLIVYSKNKLDDYLIELLVPDAVVFEDSGQRYDPAVTYTMPALQEPTPQEPAVSGPVIPDAWAFFNEEVTHEDESIENGTKAVFGFDPAHAAAAYEYVDLLENGGFGLTLADTVGQEWSNGDSTHYYFFDCPGQDVAPVEDYVPDVRDDVSGAVLLQINDWPSYGWCDVIIQYSEDLTVVDTGDRSSVTGLVDLREYKSGPMGGKGPRTGDADYTMRVGESLRLDCPRRFGANTEQFRWAVDEGADLVSLEGEISASATVTAKAPGRVVVSVVYDHSYDTTDVLTGNDTYGFAAPTYYFIIEITN